MVVDKSETPIDNNEGLKQYGVKAMEFSQSCEAKYNRNIEKLAEFLHESGREAVEWRKKVNPKLKIGFMDYDKLGKETKELRRIQARYFFKHNLSICRLLTGRFY